jgi:hypothetical protein
MGYGGGNEGIAKHIYTRSNTISLIEFKKIKINCKKIIYKSQSAVMINGMSLTGSPTVERMTKMETSPAGTELRPSEAIVAMKLTSETENGGMLIT